MSKAKPMFDRVALLGVGLIGSSMAHAMRRNNLAGHIVGHSRRADTLKRARRIGFADTKATSTGIARATSLASH